MDIILRACPDLSSQNRLINGEIYEIIKVVEEPDDIGKVDLAVAIVVEAVQRPKGENVGVSKTIGGSLLNYYYTF